MTHPTSRPTLAALALGAALATGVPASAQAATAARWKEFEAGVSAATARLRKSIETSAV